MENDAICRKKRIMKRSLLGILILSVLTCKQPFSFTEMLDERAEALAPLMVTPSQATVYVNSSLTLYTSGGEAPYEYTVSQGSGTVNSSGSYTAPSAAGTAVVTITDAVGDSVTASLTITDTQVNADYIVQSITNLPATFDVGDPIAQTFIYENTGVDDGIQTVYWNIYVSDDTTFDGGDSLVDSGSGGALLSTASSASMSINGNWPVTAGVYYLIVKLSSGDDTDPLNSTGVSAPFTIQALPGDIDYVVSDVTRNYPTVVVGSLCAETFDVTNVGGSAGSSAVTWTAYASADQTIGGDAVIASGTVSAGGLAAGGSVNDISISGAWPSAGTWYLLVGVTATDETITGNNTGSSSDTITVNAPPDYTVTSVVMQNRGTAGTAFSGGGSFSFEILESDNNPGSQPVAWEAFVSIDNILDGGDVSVLDGVIDPLAAGGSSGVISLDSAVWPAFGSYYYLIITVNSGDDADPVNNTYISVNTVTVPEITIEDEGSFPNSSVGPVTGTLPNVRTLSADGGTLSLNQLVMADGLMDASGAYDTYQVTSDAGASRLEISVEWSSGSDDIDFHVWDQSGNTWDSVEVWNDSEPRLPPPAKISLPAGTYYIGVEFKGTAVVDTAYELFIQGM